MGTGIIVCGLNGSGKSTLGKALSERIGYHFIDVEDLYFPKTDPNYLYASPRNENEVAKLLADEIKAHENFIFASVRGKFGRGTLPNHGIDVRAAYQYVVLIQVPKDIRLKRVRERDFLKFGNRVLPGGDLYEVTEAFFGKISARQDDYAEKWMESMDCPVIRIDGTKPIEENVTYIIKQLQEVQL